MSFVKIPSPIMEVALIAPDKAAYCAGLPLSGKKFWKMKNPGQGKVRELHFQSGKFKKNEKSHGKVREFQNFPKKMLANRLLEILSFHNLQAILEKECF